MTIVSGIGIATGWQELGGGGPPPPITCVYYSNYNAYDGNYNNYYDINGPLFSDQYGNGDLRTMLQGLNGDVVVESNSNNLTMYYIGNSTNNFTVTDSIGTPIFTTDFSPLYSYSNSCDTVCKTFTIPKNLNPLPNNWYLTEIGFIYSYFFTENLNSTNYGNFPLYSDTAAIDAILKNCFGPQASYSYEEDLTGIYIYFNDIFDFNPVNLTFQEFGLSQIFQGTMDSCSKGCIYLGSWNPSSLVGDYGPTNVLPINSAILPIAALGINAQVNYSPDCGIWGGDYLGIGGPDLVWSVESSQPNGWIGYDKDTSTYNPITWVKRFCNLKKRCYEVVGNNDFTATPIPLVINMNFFQTDAQVNFQGLPLDPNTDVTFSKYLKSVFGADASINIYIDYISGDWRIDIYNCYEVMSPFDITMQDSVSAFSTYYFNETNCG